MDPEVMKYFRKIIKSFSIGLLWLFVVVTAGLYFGLGVIDYALHWYNLMFYLFFVASLFWLLRFYYRVWKIRSF